MPLHKTLSIPLVVGSKVELLSATLLNTLYLMEHARGANRWKRTRAVTSRWVGRLDMTYYVDHNSEPLSSLHHVIVPLKCTTSVPSYDRTVPSYHRTVPPSVPKIHELFHPYLEKHKIFIDICIICIYIYTYSIIKCPYMHLFQYRENKMNNTENH